MNRAEDASRSLQREARSGEEASLASVDDFDVRTGSLNEPDVLALIDSWNEQLAVEIPGFTPTSGSLVREEEFRDTLGGRFLIAKVEGTTVGSGVSGDLMQKPRR